MNRLLRWTSIVVVAIVAVLSTGAGYLYAAYPRIRPASDLRVTPTPELLERGRYLAEHVSICTDCHSERDLSRFSGPVVPGTHGKGGMLFGPAMNFPGRIYASNITPAGVGHYTDGELVRAITEGVTKDGRPLFPLMPYGRFRHLCDRDLQAIVAYVRSMPSIPNRVPETELDFPVSLLVRQAPAPRDPWRCDDEAPPVERGRYLTEVAACADCHTKQERGQPIPGLDLAGGFEFPMPTGGVVRSANLTPDEETGLGRMSEEAFLDRFRAHHGEANDTPVARNGFNTIMPWRQFAGMSDDDLRAIYAFLRTVPPVRHEFARFSPGTP